MIKVQLSFINPIIKKKNTIRNFNSVSKRLKKVHHKKSIVPPLEKNHNMKRSYNSTFKRAKDDHVKMFYISLRQIINVSQVVEFLIREFKIS